MDQNKNKKWELTHMYGSRFLYCGPWFDWALGNKLFFVSKEVPYKGKCPIHFVDINSWLSRSTTARGSCTGLVTVGPTKV